MRNNQGPYRMIPEVRSGKAEQVEDRADDVVDTEAQSMILHHGVT